jgi:archaeosine-15-forming tRNA-guanine transglycosylase
MEKKYVYENAIVRVTVHNESSEHIRRATENFLKKVIAEKENKK